MVIGWYNMLMESYTNMFTGFLHINFFVRILLFITFILFAEIALEVIILPVFLSIVGPIVMRGWNFAVTETFCEYIYIKHLSDTSKVPHDKASAKYNKLLKKIEKNYQYIYNKSEFDEAVTSRGRRYIVNKKITDKSGGILEIFILVFAAIFIITTSVYDLSYSKDLGNLQASSKGNVYDTTDIADNTNTETDNEEYEEYVTEKYFVLSEGTLAANIRSEPSFETSSVIEQVTNKVVLEYMGESVPFDDESDAFWHKIKTESGTIGWISGKIVVEKE